MAVVGKVISSEQIREILLGKISGVDTSVYDNIDIDASKMAAVRKSLEKGIDLTKEIEDWKKYTGLQLLELGKALHYGVNVNLMLNPRLSPCKMREIFRALSNGVDPTPYASPAFDSDCMSEYTNALKDGVDITIAINPDLNIADLKVVLTALREKQGVPDELY